MSTQTPRQKSAKKALDAFEKQLVPHGWQGDITDYDEVIDFAHEKGLEFDKTARANLRAAQKALVVSEGESSNQLIIDYVPDEGEMELDEEDAPADDEDAKALKASIDRKFRDMERSIKSLTWKSGQAPKVETKLPGQAQWEARKRLDQAVFRDAETAHKFGLLLASSLRKEFGSERASEAAKSLGKYAQKAQATSPISAGGATIFDNPINEVLATFDEYGVARRYSRVIPIPSGNAELMEDRNGISAGYPGEGNAITESDLDFANVHLRAKKLAMLAKLSSEIIQDSYINIAEYVAGRFVDTAQQKEDEALFLGDGTATYGGINGLGGTFTAKDSDYRNVTGAAASESHTLANIRSLMAKMPLRYRKGAAFHCHSSMTSYIFDRLAGSVGGVQMQEVMGYGYIKTFAGVPIVENFVMNSDPSSSDDVVDVFYANLGEAAIFGDCRSLDVKSSDIPLMDSDQTLIVGTRRYDINVWNLGDNNSQSPVVALWQD